MEMRETLAKIQALFPDPLARGEAPDPSPNGVTPTTPEVQEVQKELVLELKDDFVDPDDHEILLESTPPRESGLSPWSTQEKECQECKETEKVLAGPECESAPERTEGNSIVWVNGDEGLSDRELFGEFRGWSVINYDEPVHYPKGSMLKGVFTECEVVTVRELDIGDIVRYKKKQISLLKDQYGIVIKKDNISVVVDDIMYIPQKMGELGFGSRRLIEGEKCGYKIGKQTF